LPWLVKGFRCAETINRLDEMNDNMERPHEVQLSRSNSKNLDAGAASYQQQQVIPNQLGPGIAKILEHQRREHEGEEMKRRTRILYALMGVLLLCIYFTLLKRHFFEKHGIVVPSFIDQNEDLQGTLRL
jgi:hypothetical protein